MTSDTDQDAKKWAILLTKHVLTVLMELWEYRDVQVHGLQYWKKHKLHDKSLNEYKQTNKQTQRLLGNNLMRRAL